MTIKLPTTIFLLFFFFNSLVHGQNEAQKWYFGTNAGLNFSTSPPSALTNTFFSCFEGCSSICDNQGNFLFCTQGIVVYDQTGSVMANGIGLMGGMSSTQSSMVVKRPGSNSIYYIFTVAEFADPEGLRYSVVDMSLAAGLGSVTTQNVLLHTPSCEKLAAVMHCNGVDVWMLSHDYNSSNFRANLVTAAGVNTVAVLSNSGNLVNGTGFLGQMKVSTNGKKIGFMYGNNLMQPSPAQIFDFDPATGIVSNPLNLSTFVNGYSCEFSPDCTKFYAAAEFGNQIVQWDLCAGNAQAIQSSSLAMPTSTDPIGSLQLAPDGKIYLARNNASFLGVINSPNLQGTACNFVTQGLVLSPAFSSYGLPAFNTSFLKPAPAPFSYTLNCNNISVNTFFNNQSCTAINNPTTSLWSFGDPTSGPANSSTLNSTSHTFSATGTYSVQLIRNYACTSETIVIPVTVANVAPPITVSGIFTICPGQSKTFTVSGAGSYTWSSGSNSATAVLSPTATTVYTVTGAATSTTFCKVSKQFTVTVAKCTGIDVVDEQNQSFSVYPNPFSGNLFVETALPVRIKIRDNSGIIILDKSFENGRHNLDISSFPNGIYTLQSFSKQGSKVIRLVKIE